MEALRGSLTRPALLLPSRRPWVPRTKRLFGGQGRRTALSAAEVAEIRIEGKAAGVVDSANNGAKNLDASSPAPAISPDSATGTFPWFSHWYPVAVVDDLDPGRPHATHLLGISLAVWRDKQGAWHAVEDKCPHRLAPLSEGRVEADGTLQCAYHGWQFDGRGACTAIPQLRNDDRAHQVACASRRSCVRAFPTQVAHGLLWVLPDSSREAHDKFARDPALPANVVRELLGGPESEGIRRCTPWFARDMAIRYDTLLENVVDPSHVPFAHHGVQGRRENEKGTITKVVDEIRFDGFAFDLDSKRPGGDVVRPSFAPPNYVLYSFPMRSMHIYVVPTKPGWSRLYVTFTQDTKKPNKVPWLINTIIGLSESITWLEHVAMRNAVLDGDTYMIHVQERLLEEQKGQWKEAFYMPAPSDGSVVGLRKWIDQYGGVIPTCEPGTLPPAMSKREVLDRYSQHTAHCRHCQKALRGFDLATAVAAACSLLAAAWLAARAFVGLPLLSPAAGLGAMALLASAALAAALRRYRQQFFFVDYVHAEKK